MIVISLVGRLHQILICESEISQQLYSISMEKLFWYDLEVKEKAFKKLPFLVHGSGSWLTPQHHKLPLKGRGKRGKMGNEWCQKQACGDSHNRLS